MAEVTVAADEKKIPEVRIEVKRVDNLKPEIRTEFNLGSDGLAFKIMTHNSPYGIRYEKLEGDLLHNMSQSLKNADLKGFVGRLRK